MARPRGGGDGRPSFVAAAGLLPTHCRAQSSRRAAGEGGEAEEHGPAADVACSRAATGLGSRDWRPSKRASAASVGCAPPGLHGCDTLLLLPSGRQGATAASPSSSSVTGCSQKLRPATCWCSGQPSADLLRLVSSVCTPAHLALAGLPRCAVCCAAGACTCSGAAWARSSGDTSHASRPVLLAGCGSSPAASSPCIAADCSDPSLVQAPPAAAGPKASRLLAARVSSRAWYLPVSTDTCLLRPSATGGAPTLLSDVHRQSAAAAALTAPAAPQPSQGSGAEPVHGGLP